MILGVHTAALGSVGAQLGSTGASIVVTYPALIRFTLESMAYPTFTGTAITEPGFDSDSITDADMIDSDLES